VNAIAFEAGSKVTAAIFRGLSALSIALLAVFTNLATNAGLPPGLGFLEDRTIDWVIFLVLLFAVVAFGASRSSPGSAWPVEFNSLEREWASRIESEARLPRLSASTSILLVYLAARYVSLPLVSIAIGATSRNATPLYDAGTLTLGLIVTAVCVLVIGSTKIVAVIAGTAVIMDVYSVRELLESNLQYTWLSLIAGILMLLIVLTSLVSSMFNTRLPNCTDLRLPDRAKRLNGPDLLAFLAMLAYLSNWFFSVIYDISSTKQRLLVDGITIAAGIGITVVLMILHGRAEPNRSSAIIVLPVVGMGLSLAAVDIATNLSTFSTMDWSGRVLLGREMVLALIGVAYIGVLVKLTVKNGRTGRNGARQRTARHAA
jgi:hypothetical protein